jgi:hypothetical protein
VQGATLAAARYHPTDRSSFEEGYVALTRGRDTTRLYVIDGTTTSDDETGHVPPEPESSGLVDIIGSMSERHANAMVHDAAADAYAVMNAANNLTLAKLDRQRRRVSRVLDQVPSLPRPSAVQVEWREDRGRARSRLRPDLGFERASRDTIRSEPTRTRLTAVRQAEAVRNAWLDARAPERRLSSVLRRAIQARRVRVRTGAAPNNASGPQRAHLTRVRAAEREALERDL